MSDTKENSKMEPCKVEKCLEDMKSWSYEPGLGDVFSFVPRLTVNSPAPVPSTPPVEDGKKKYTYLAFIDERGDRLM